MVPKTKQDPESVVKEIKRKTMLLRRKQKRSLRLAGIAGKVYMSAETIS